MKKHWQVWLVQTPLLIISLLLCGCASTDNYAAALNSWKGVNINALFVRWGYPNRILQLVNGHWLYVYQFEDRGEVSTTMPEFTTAPVADDAAVISTMPLFKGGTFYELKCITWFEVDKNNRIVSMSFRGNNCMVSQKIAARLTKFP